MPPEAEAVLSFWLGVPGETGEARMKRWFGGGEAIDREVRERFGELVRRAQDGELSSWEAEPRSRLALVVVLDQLSRNVFRGDPRAHAGDALALRLAVDAFDRGWDRELTLAEKRWLVMPLLHAEDARVIERAKGIFDALAQGAPPAEKGFFESGVARAEKYRAVVARFGRFPHRNAALGRVSTPEEEAFLETWDGPGGKRSG